MWVFVERYGVPSAPSTVTAAALNSHARCRRLLRELPEGEIRLAKTADPDIRSALCSLDVEAGRLEAYWYLVLRDSDVERWHRASARCRRVRRLLAPLTGLASRGAARVVLDAQLSGHPKRARAARRAAQAIERQGRGQRIDKRMSKIATLLRRDAGAWRTLLDRYPGLDDASMERSLLRSLLRQRDQTAAFAAADPGEMLARPTDLRKQQQRAQRLIWQLELIGASGSDGLDPLLSGLKKSVEPLVEQHTVAVFASQLDKLPLQDADRRWLKKAAGKTLARLHGGSTPLAGWPGDDLAMALRRAVRRWALRGSLGDWALAGEGI